MSDRQTNESTEPGAAEGQPCLWFFLPLPQPLGLPHGWTVERPLDPLEILRSRGQLSHVSCSLLVHQVTPSADALLSLVKDLYSMAVAAVAEETPEEVGGVLADAIATGTDQFESQLTILEAACPLADPNLSEEFIDQKLDYVLDLIGGLQIGIAGVSRQPVEMIARATLPPVVPVFFGRLVPDAPRPDFDGSVPFPVRGSAPPGALSQRPVSLNADELAALNVFMANSTPFFRYVDLRRDAMVQTHHQGNARLAVASLATAGEVLLDTTLLMLVWEDRMAPPDAGGLFDRSQSHTSRVTNQLPPRLGGRWETVGDHPVGKYFSDLVRLRHRVIHAGHLPTESELAAAWQALYGMERFLGDRLAAEGHLNRYPRTAVTWAGRRGLERRGRWTRRVAELADRERNWATAFERYRRHVDRAMIPEGSAPGADPHVLVLYAFSRPAMDTTWALHDPTSLHAALVADPSGLVSQEQVHQVELLLDETATPDDLGSQRMAVEFETSAVRADELDWRPEGELFVELDMFPSERGTAEPGGDSRLGM